MSEEKLVPKLRFPGYRQKWVTKKLIEICEINDGTHFTPNYVKKGVPFFSVETITNNNPPKFISKNDHLKLIKRCCPKKGDILITRIGTLCESKLINWTYEFSIYVSLALIFSIKINNIFLNQYFKTPYFKRDFLRKSLLLAIPQKINLKDLNTVIVTFPSMEEQTKIGNFLSAVDKKIESLNQLHENYIKFKKGLLQQIFTQKIQFKKEKWITIALSDIGVFYRGHSYNKENVVKKGLIVLRSNNIKNNSLIFDKSELCFVNNDCKEEIKLQKNDIVICMNNGSKKLVGKSACYTKNCNEDITVGAFCSIFRSKNPLANYLLQTYNYRRYIYMIIAGSNINNLKNSEIEKFKFKIPQSLEEQEKIANFLSAIDKRIELIQFQIEKMNELKKGLLQEMFI